MSRKALQAKPSPSLSGRATTLGLGALILSVYLATASYTVSHIDVASSAVAGWHIANTGSPWLDGVPLETLTSDTGLPLWSGVAQNGHVAVFRSPGAIAASIPPYLLSARGTDLADFSFAPIAAWAAILTTCSMLLLLGALRRQRAAHAAAAVAALAFTTPVWSVAADMVWPHTVTILGISGMAWAAARERWWLVGLFGGVALWGRLHAALIVAILGLAVALWHRRPAIALKVGLPSAALLALATVWSRWMYGEWDPAGGYPTVDVYAANASAANRTDQLVNELGLLVAPERGLLVWTPLLLLLLPAVVRSWRDLPDWVRGLAIGGVAYGVVQGLMNGFGGGDGYWGYRLTLEPLVALFPAYALSAARVRRVGRALIGPLLGLQFSAMLIGALANGTSLLEEDFWHDNSYLSILREQPVAWAWPTLMMLVGHLAAQVWFDRGFHAAAASPSTSLGIRSPDRPGQPH